MSAASRISAKIHKWLALLMAIQILFWFVSGLFFAVFPIERVRSEHVRAEQPARPVSLGMAADGLRGLAARGVSGDKVELRLLLERPVALVTPHDGRPQLYDLPTGLRLSPLSMSAAARIAEADHVGDLRAVRVERITANSPEYRGPLPAWRVDFDDSGNRSFYIAADTGAVTARRSTLWRVYDFLWGLHIMDWRGHEDFNSPLLIATTFLGLVIIITGIVMFPSRLGYNAWRRRRRALAQSPPDEFSTT
jgi:hypothetical protein